MILDVIVIAVVLITGIVGIKKGLIAVITKLVGVILATILAFTLYKSVASYLYSNFSFGKSINAYIQNAIGSSQNEEEEKVSITEILNKFGLQNKVNIEEEKENIDDGTTLTQVVANKITSYIMNIIAFLVVFIVVIIVTAVASLILSAIFSMPLLSSINKIGGFAIEIVLSLIKLWVILELISILSPMSGMQWINAQIEASVFVKFLYEHNLLTNLIGKIKI